MNTGRVYAYAEARKQRDFYISNNMLMLRPSAWEHCCSMPTIPFQISRLWYQAITLLALTCDRDLLIGVWSSHNSVDRVMDKNGNDHHNAISICSASLSSSAPVACIFVSSFLPFTLGRPLDSEKNGQHENRNTLDCACDLPSALVFCLP